MTSRGTGFGYRCRAIGRCGWRSRAHYASLPPDARQQVDARVEQLLENPRQQPRSGYDERSDQWTTTYGDGAGLIVYAVVHDRQRVIILRLV